MLTLSPPKTAFETDVAGQIIYPIDNGEPLANDTEHLKWITFLKNGLEDWYGDRNDVFIAADLLWYPVEGRPDVCKAPDVMVVLDHPSGPRDSYQQWFENDRPPNVVFEFLSKSNTAREMIDKLDFYSDAEVGEYFIYDYQRGVFNAFRRNGGNHLQKVKPEPDGAWKSKLLEMTFGLDSEGRLWVRRPDGELMKSQREIAKRAEAEAKRAEAEAKRADAETARAERLAAKLREMGVDPDAV